MNILKNISLCYLIIVSTSLSAQNLNETDLEKKTPSVKIFSDDPAYQKHLQDLKEGKLQNAEEDKLQLSKDQKEPRVIRVPVPVQSKPVVNTTQHFVFHNQTHSENSEQSQSETDLNAYRKAQIEALRQEASRKNK